jgi:hypothetical protein
MAHHATSHLSEQIVDQHAGERLSLNLVDADTFTDSRDAPKCSERRCQGFRGGGGRTCSYNRAFHYSLVFNSFAALIGGRNRAASATFKTLLAAKRRPAP